MATQAERDAEKERTIYERRKKAIENMPPGPERDKAIEDLSRDYKGRTKAGEKKRDNVRDDIEAAFAGIPTGAKSSAPGNPFAVSVADPFGAAAQGYKAYRGLKEEKDAEAVLEGLSQGQERATAAMIDPGAGEAEAALVSSMSPAPGNPVDMGLGGSGASEVAPRAPMPPVSPDVPDPVLPEVQPAAPQSDAPYRGSIGRALQDEARKRFDEETDEEKALRMAGFGR